VARRYSRYIQLSFVAPIPYDSVCVIPESCRQENGSLKLARRSQISLWGSGPEAGHSSVYTIIYTDGDVLTSSHEKLAKQFVCLVQLSGYLPLEHPHLLSGNPKSRIHRKWSLIMSSSPKGNSSTPNTKHGHAFGIPSSSGMDP
jgi:hypothetical protein